MKYSKDTVQIKANEKVKLFSRSFSSVPMKYEFAAEGLAGHELLGKLEIHCKQILRKKSVITRPINKTNTINASMWDTFVTVYVIAEQDLQVSKPQRKMRSLGLILSLVVLIVAMASALMFAQLW